MIEFNEYKPNRAPCKTAEKDKWATLGQFIGITIAGCAFFAALWFAAILDGASL